MKILVSYRGIPQSPGWATGDSVVRALRALGHDTFAYAKYYQENRWIESLTDAPSEYDLCLFLECNDGDPQYCELKNIRARKTACWTFDNSYYQDHLRGLIDYFKFDFKFLANPLIVKEFQELGYSNINYLPYACDPELHSRPLSYPKIRDVVLVGSIREDRIELANKLKKYNINLELIGGLYREAYIDALASAKIVINQNPEIGAGLLNMRWMETAAAGSIILGEDRDLSVNKLFCFGGAHGYSSIDGLVELCSTYLGQENTQDWIRHISYKNVHKLHTYQNRCQEILKTVFPNES